MKQKILSYSVILLIGFFTGRYFSPTKIETKIVEKIVEKTNKNEDKTINITTVVKPDGTKVTKKSIVSSKQSTTQKDSNIKKLEVKTYKDKTNAVGVRSNLLSPDIDIYVRAGTTCFILNCYVEGSYQYFNRDVGILLGVEFRY